MRLNVCFDEIAPFEPFAAFVKGWSTSDRDGRNGDHPQGTKMFGVERHGLPEDFVSFCALCVEFNRRHSYLRRIGRLSGVRYYSGMHWERLCSSGLRSPELSAQVRPPNSCTT